MQIQNDTTIHTNTAGTAAAGSSQTTAAAADFQAVYRAKVKQLWNDFQKTGMTAADQQLKETGGEEALMIKKEKIAEKKRQQNTSQPEVETIKKYMPDGSILMITTKNGKVVEQYRKKPHLMRVTDVLHTPKEALTSGSSLPVKTKLVPFRNIFED